MLKQQVAHGPGGRVLVMDSIAQVAADDADAIVVAASHGGASSAHYALQVPLALVVFNDAGVGKDAAGIAGLKLLQERGVAAAAVSHSSARIGDAQDMWDHGQISHVNAAARRWGLVPGAALRDALTKRVNASDAAIAGPRADGPLLP